MKPGGFKLWVTAGFDLYKPDLGGDEDRLSGVDVAHAREAEGAKRGVLRRDAPLVLLVVAQRLAVAVQVALVKSKRL